MNTNSGCSISPSTNVTNPPWLGLSVLLLAGFVTIFDLFVVNVAIPVMQTDLTASFAQIGFIVAGYELAFGVLLITGGRLGDLFGRRRLFVMGMAGFTLASALCGLALLLVSLIEGPGRHWPGWSFVALTLSAGLLVAFYYQQERQRQTGYVDFPYFTRDLKAS